MATHPNPESFKTITREASALSRRRSLMALGGAGLLAAVAGHAPAEAGRKRKKRKDKNKKRCKREKRKCRSHVEDFCAQFDLAGQVCLDGLLPCCDTCKTGKGVICVAEFFTDRALDIETTEPA